MAGFAGPSPSIAAVSAQSDIPEPLLQGVLGRIRDVRSGPDGLLYLLTDESPGVLARIEPRP